MKKIINVFTLGVFLISNIITPLTNFIYAEETETLEEGGDLSVVRDMENIGNDNEVIPQTAPEESGETSKESVETPNPEDSQSEENITPDEQPSEETQGDEQVNKQEDNQEDNQSDESSVELADPTESHNSATTPVKDEEDNNDTSATQGEQSIDEDREIMGTCPAGQIHNDDLNITYSCTLKNNVPVYYGTDMDSTHRYNNNPIGTITVFVPIDNEEVPITMMDMNLGATSTEINNPNSYGERYQRGNNAGLRNTSSTSTYAQYKDYRPGNPFSNSTYIVSPWDYWESSKHYDNLWGGTGDGYTSNIYSFWGGIKNGKTRQGPCPEGYHVPSLGEWNTLVTYWYNMRYSENRDYTSLITYNSPVSDTSNSFSSIFKLPTAGARSDQGIYNNACSYWTSSPSDDNWHKGEYSYILGINYLNSTPTIYHFDNPRVGGRSLRCFKDSPDAIIHEVTFHDDSGRISGANGGVLKQILEDGQQAQQPTTPLKGGGSEFLGWTKTLNGTDYFDFSTPVEEDINLYAKWICEEGYTEKEDKTGCEFIGYFDVNFNPNGGAFSGKAVDEALKITYSMNGPDEIIPIYNIQIPNKEPTGQTGWMFAGWYTKSGINNDWGEEFNISNPTQNTAYAKWLPFKELEFEYNGQKIIIMDRNLGAEDVAEGRYYENNDYEESSKLGFYYQRGNNYGFKNEGTVIRDSNRITGSDFGPGNYYYNNKFINSNRRTIEINTNLWFRGYYYPDTENQGPCPAGYHIPTNSERSYLINNPFYYWKNSPEGQQVCNELGSDAQCFAYKFKLPFAGYRYHTDSSIQNKGKAAYYLASTRYGGNNGDRVYHMNIDKEEGRRFGANRNWLQGIAMPVRCFKDTGKIIIFNSNGGEKIDNWSNKQLRNSVYSLPTPSHQDLNMVFRGWYTTPNFEEDSEVTQTAITGDSDSNIINIYAKWECEDMYIKDNNSCKAKFPTTTLLSGQIFNTTLKSFIEEQNITSYESEDNLMKGFVWSDVMPADGTNKIVISTEDSEYPVYAWFDKTGYENGEGIVYYTSKSKDIYLNTNSMNMFTSFNGLTELNLSRLNPKKIRHSYQFISNTNNLKYLNLDNRNFSGIKNIDSSLTRMFDGVNSLKELSLKNWKIPEEFTHMLGGRTTRLSAELDWIDVSGWDLSETKSIQGLFGSSYTHEIRGLDTWDTSNITNIANMFGSCPNLTGLNLDNWNLSNLSNVGSLYSNSPNLKTISMKNWILPETVLQRVSGWTASLTANLDWVDVSGWDLSKTKSIQGVFAGNQTKEIRGLDTWNTSNIEDMSQTFQQCSNLTGLDLSNWDTSNVTDMHNMFLLTTNLEHLDLTTWDTSNVKNMSAMFISNNALTTLDLSNWDTSNVENMAGMFNNCTNLTGLNLDNWDLSNAPTMTNMFQGANNLKALSLKNWKIPTSFRNILGGATDTSSRNNLTAELDWIDVTNWDLSETEDLMGVFGDNKTKEIRGLGTWDTSNVKDMSEMFAGTPRLTVLDLSNWDTSNVENMTYMFVASSALKTIYASEKFDTTKATDVINSMFAYTALVGGQGTVYDWNHAGTDYAKIDGGPHNPGYFTQSNSIRYNLDGGELQHPKTAYAPIGSFTLNKPTKEGYTFSGWTGSNGNVPQREVTIQEGTQGNLEFTANWEINKYQIIFDTDGGNEMAPVEVEYNSILSGAQLPTPSKEGHKFVGWTGLPETMPAEDITIVASWERVGKNSSSSGGGGGSTSPIDVVEKTVNDNTHNAADEKSEERSSDGKEGSSDSSDTASVEANYSPEFIEAYNFAKTNGITTQSNIQKAKMNSPLTRIAMAKMLSYYAINVLGQEPDMSKTINFDDVSAKRDAEYDNGVTLAYQLGIMGINMKNNKFRPNDEVTRAEFATALSRMIYGMRDGTGKQKYYEPHMARLYNEGVINKTDPKMKEKRGYVMIMLMRTVK